MTKTSWIITAFTAAILGVGTVLILQTDRPVSTDPHGHAHGEAEEDHDDHSGRDHVDSDSHDDHSGHDHVEGDSHSNHSDEAATGPHGGRLLQVANGYVEVVIFESGTPPEFRLYVADHDANAAITTPESWRIIVTNSNRADTFTFETSGEYLRSRETIDEPHEFNVSVRGMLDGSLTETSYFQAEEHHNGHGGTEDSGESLGMVRLDAAILSGNGVTFAQTGPGTVASEIQLPGEVALNADRVAHIVPRFPGIAQQVFKRLGDNVQSGDVLAIVQSNESVAPYEIKSLIAGTVVERHITLGEYVRDDADVFVVADLSSVWVHISIYPKYFDHVQPGVRVRLRTTGVEASTDGVIDYVGPIVGEQTRTAQARVVLDNSTGRWQPGLFVTAHLLAEEHLASLVVPDDAVQTVEGQTAVFVKRADGVEARAIKLGKSDGRWIEVISGLAPGEEIAISNTFLLKAEFGKSEAGHDH